MQLKECKPEEIGGDFCFVLEACGSGLEDLFNLICAVTCLQDLFLALATHPTEIKDDASLEQLWGKVNLTEPRENMVRR